MFFRFIGLNLYQQSIIKQMELTRTITFKGVELDVVFDYQPEEKEDGFTKFSAEIEVTDVQHQGESINELIEDVSEIEEELFKHI